MINYPHAKGFCVTVQAIEFYLSGNVQGVGLRDWLIRMGLAHYNPPLRAIDVANLDNGQVRVTVKGDSETLRRFYQDCGARVNELNRSGRVRGGVTHPQRLNVDRVPDGVARGDFPGERSTPSQLTNRLRSNPEILGALAEIDEAVEANDFNRLMRLMEPDGSDNLVNALMDHGGMSRDAATRATQIEINLAVKHRGGWPKFIHRAIESGTVPASVKNAYNHLLQVVSQTDDFFRIRDAWVPFQRALETAMPDERLAIKAGVKMLSNALNGDLAKFVAKAARNAVPGLSAVFAAFDMYNNWSAGQEMRAQADAMLPRPADPPDPAVPGITQQQYNELLAMIDEIENRGYISAGMGLTPGGIFTAGAVAGGQMVAEMYIEELRGRFAQLAQQYETDLTTAARATVSAHVLERWSQRPGRHYLPQDRFPGVYVENGVWHYPDGRVQMPLRLQWSDVEAILRQEGHDPDEILDFTKDQIRQNDPEARRMQQELNRLQNNIRIIQDRIDQVRGRTSELERTGEPTRVAYTPESDTYNGATPDTPLPPPDHGSSSRLPDGLFA